MSTSVDSTETRRHPGSSVGAMLVCQRGLMRAALFLLPLVTTCSMAMAVPQDPKAKSKTPKSGDTIVVKGCLRGGMLEATEMGVSVEDEDDRLPAAHTFQLKGKK